MRIQKWLASCGVGSRRAVEKMIAEGRIRVNGQLAEVGHDVDPDKDLVEVDGNQVKPPAGVLILMLNKPTGYVSTVNDPQGRPTVMDLLPEGLPRLYPVGRLDRDSHGLLLFTNDGELTHALLHPSRGVWKRYVARVEQPLSAATLEQLRKGVSLEDGVTSVCRAWNDKDTQVILEIKEGRKRQVRRMLGVLGHPVKELQRVGFGPLQLGNLALGKCRRLTAVEEQSLRGGLVERSAPAER